MSNDVKSCSQGWWLSALWADDTSDSFTVDYVPSRDIEDDPVEGREAEAMSALLTHALIGDYTAIKGLCILVKRNPAKFGEYQATAEALVEAYESKRVRK